MNVVEEIWD